MSDTVFVDICLDFDGVLHSYKSRWQGADVIPDPPVNGAIVALYRYLNDFSLAIFSARSSQEGGIDAMRTWLEFHDARFRERAGNFDINISRGTAKSLEKGTLIDRIAFPDHKPAASLYVDDRGFRFEGRWLPPDELRKLFTPWYGGEV